MYTEDGVDVLGVWRVGRADLPGRNGRATLVLCGAKQSRTLILLYSLWFVAAPWAGVGVPCVTCACVALQEQTAQAGYEAPVSGNVGTRARFNGDRQEQRPGSSKEPFNRRTKGTGRDHTQNLKAFALL